MKKLAFAAFALAVFGAVQAAPIYKFTDLGALADSSSEASGINNLGEVSGYSWTNANIYQATVWRQGTLIPLKYFGGNFSQAFGINNAGQVVGTSNNATNLFYPVVWDDSTSVRVLSTSTGVAYGINNAGQATGLMEVRGIGAHAALWSSAAEMDLGNGLGLAINDVGRVVGASMYQAIEYDGAYTTNLPGLGGLGTKARAINHSGLVAGYSWRIGNESTGAVSWESGVLTELSGLGGRSSEARGINNAGSIVGWSNRPDDYQRAVIWNGKTVTDLNTFLDADTINAGWTLALATGINDSGSIVGDAVNSNNPGQMRGFLLSAVSAPVPEPSTYALLLVGLLMLSVQARIQTRHKEHRK